MKKITIKTIILVPTIFAALSWAEPSVTAAEIIGRVDSVVNAPKDQTMNMKLVLIDKNGNEREREIVMQQKGSDRRIGKFLAPADQKGIAFLSLPEGVMYIYLPAFKKTRRIASHVKNTKFAGTDFTYEDMEASAYSEKYDAELVEQKADSYVLRLRPKKGVESEYSMLLLHVDKNNFVPTRIDHFDKAGKSCKIMTRSEVEKIDGYWFAKRSEMADLRSGQKTIMILETVRFDQGLSDDIFTERYLQR